MRLVLAVSFALLLSACAGPKQTAEDFCLFYPWVCDQAQKAKTQLPKG